METSSQPIGPAQERQPPYLPNELLGRLDADVAQQHAALASSVSLAWRYMLRRTSRYADVHPQPAQKQPRERITEVMREHELSSGEVAGALCITADQACSLIRNQTDLSARELLPIIARLGEYGANKPRFTQLIGPRPFPHVMPEWQRCTCRVCVAASATCFQSIERERRRKSKWMKYHCVLPFSGPSSLHAGAQQGTVSNA